MRLGLIADIHEEVEYLHRALTEFRRRGVDRIVMLGDVVAMTDHLRETVELLASVDAVGVWGNHDFGLCHHPDEHTRARWAGPVLDYMTTLQPRLVIEDCLFTHVEPWLDPEDLLQLWYFEGPPDTVEKLARN
jgi:hypothetical protein